MWDEIETSVLEELTLLLRRILAKWQMAKDRINN